MIFANPFRRLAIAGILGVLLAALAIGAEPSDSNRTAERAPVKSCTTTATSKMRMMACGGWCSIRETILRAWLVI